MRKQGRFPWWPRKKRPVVDRKSLAAALAVVGALLLVALVLQQSVSPGRPLVEKLPAPSFADFMPAGAKPSGASLEIAELPQPSYVVAFEQGADAGLALVAWSKDLQHYVLASSVLLSDGPARLTHVTQISLEGMGTGAAPVILARGASGGVVDGLFVVSRGPEGIALVRTMDENKAPGPAFFLEGQGNRSIEEFALEDVDSDGRKEAIATRRMTNELGEPTKALVRAYRWSSGTLDYDKDLSWALTVSQDIFPEPKPAAAPAKK